MPTPFSQRVFLQWSAWLSLPLLALGATIVPLAAMGLNPSSVEVQTLSQQTLSQQTLSQQTLSQQPMMGGTRSRLQRVRFAPGASSATIKSSVVNGTRDRYLLGAQKGQTMTVRIVSLEDNAVFDVVAPSDNAGQRQTLQQEAVVWSDTLPATGDYQIVVGTTRGNASYRLQVTIK